MKIFSLLLLCMFPMLLIAQPYSLIQSLSDPTQDITQPQGITVDATGNIYVADSNGQRVVILAGVNSSAPGTELFSISYGMGRPTGITLDDDGNMYIVDTNNNCVYIMTGLTTPYPPGTLMATITEGFNSPAYGVALDSAGRIYVADSANNRVVVMMSYASHDAGFVLATLTADMYGFSNPEGLTLDLDDNLYVVDSNNGRIVVLAPFGSAQWGGAPLYTFTDNLNKPSGIALDAWGNMYIADMFDFRFVVLSSIKSATPGAQLYASPTFEMAIAIDVDANGQIYATSNTIDVYQGIPQPPPGYFDNVSTGSNNAGSSGTPFTRLTTSLGMSSGSGSSTASSSLPLPSSPESDNSTAADDNTMVLVPKYMLNVLTLLVNNLYAGVDVPADALAAVGSP